MDGQVFANRREAGAVLAAALGSYKDRDDVVVLALPRGGVPVGYEVAKRLGAPLDVFVVRKLGVPGHRELAMGAIAPGGVRVLNRSIVDWYHIPPHAIEETAREEAKGSPHEQEFDKLDKNGDGKLSREEHAAAHRAKASTGGTAKSDSGSAAAASSAPAPSSAPTVGPSQSSSERTAEPQPSTPAAPTGEKKY